MEAVIINMNILSLLFKEHCVCINASADDIISVMKAFAKPQSRIQRFSKESFFFRVWQKTFNGRYCDYFFRGSINADNGKSVVKYQMIPGITALILLLPISLFFLAAVFFALLKNDPINTAIYSFVGVIFAALIVFGIKQSVHKRFLDKLHSIDS